MTWRYLFKPPWKTSERKFIAWLVWLVGWLWWVTGLLGGALYTPSLAQAAGLSSTPYREGFVIAVAALAGTGLQVLGGTLIAVAASFVELLGSYIPAWVSVNLLIGTAVVFGVIVGFVPIASVSYALFLFFALAGTDQGTAAIAVAGGLLVETLIVILIRSIMAASASKRAARQAHGDARVPVGHRMEK